MDRRLLLFLLSLIWGSSFLLMKRGLEVFPPDQVAVMRIFFTFLCLLPFLPRSLAVVEKRWMPALLVVSLFGSGIPPFLFTKAQTHISSAVAGMLNSLTPLFTLVLGVLLFGVVYRPGKLLGVGVGLAGAAMLLAGGASPETGAEPSSGGQVYGLLVVAATLCYALSINTVKAYCQNIPAMTLNAMIFLLIGPLAGIYLLLFTDFLHILQTVSGAGVALGHVVALAVFGTALGTLIYIRLTQMTDALYAANVTYLMPAVAVLLGLLDGESLGMAQLAGLALILAGVWLSGKG